MPPAPNAIQELSTPPAITFVAGFNPVSRAASSVKVPITASEDKISGKSEASNPVARI